jgi:DNA-binding response OmpR family regulator
MTKKILIIEDEPDQAFIFSARLKANGYETIVANDGEIGLAKIKTEKPDLVLLDMNIPKIPGAELCEKVKSDNELKNIPIIFLSAGNINEIMEISEEAGADACLNKLYDPEELLETIKKLIKGKHN